jgi:hypothetical protein
MVGELEGKRALGRPRRRWEDNTRMYLKVGKVLTACIWIVGTSGGLL